MNDELVTSFDIQARVCQGMGSPLYGELLRRIHAELLEGSPSSPFVALLDDWSGDVSRDFVALRVMGGHHDLVLGGKAPELAAHYPSAGGEPRFPACWDAFRSTAAEHADALRAGLGRVPQTNEVRRSASLIGGFLEIGRRFSLPLRLRELGASAGLNLFWNEHRYELGPHRWGDDQAPLTLRCDWQGEPPPLLAPISVESRAGCDRSPIDVTDDDGLRSLRAYFWADQVERHERLRRAADRLRQDPPRLERASAAQWLARELEDAWPDGCCFVVYHSSFWVYLTDEERASILSSLERAGASSTRDRPLAWLRAEDEDPGLSLRLTTWPDGTDHKLASVHPHGEWVHWSPATTDSNGATAVPAGTQLPQR